MYVVEINAILGPRSMLIDVSCITCTLGEFGALFIRFGHVLRVFLNGKVENFWQNCLASSCFIHCIGPNIFCFLGSSSFEMFFFIFQYIFVLKVVQLTWWPLCRDSISYCIATVALIGVSLHHCNFSQNASCILNIAIPCITIYCINSLE